MVGGRDDGSSARADVFEAAGAGSPAPRGMECSNVKSGKEGGWVLYLNHEKAETRMWGNIRPIFDLVCVVDLHVQVDVREHSTA